jgi:hypothetical protein
MEYEGKFIGYLIHRCQADAAAGTVQRQKSQKASQSQGKLRFTLYET